MTTQSPSGPALTSVGLFVRLEARTGHEEEVENFLRKALDMVGDEPETVVWFAFRIGPSTFGIFDAFPDENGRQAHLNGAVAKALGEKGSELLASEPTIERLDVLAARLPALAPTGDDR
jgi:quinol monooxygenase YgiN